MNLGKISNYYLPKKKISFFYEFQSEYGFSYLIWVSGIYPAIINFNKSNKVYFLLVCTFSQLVMSDYLKNFPCPMRFWRFSQVFYVFWAGKFLSVEFLYKLFREFATQVFAREIPTFFNKSFPAAWNYQRNSCIFERSKRGFDYAWGLRIDRRHSCKQHCGCALHDSESPFCRYLGKASMSKWESGKRASLIMRKNGHAIFSQITAAL